MKTDRILLASLIVFLVLSELQLSDARAEKTKLTPEEEAIYLGKHLRPIPDEEWNSIAGPKVTEKYTITKGDTLSEISKRLFGDPKYWPKVWALNNNAIANPHHLKPGVLIAFSPGTGNSLPAVALNDERSENEASDGPAPASAMGLTSNTGRSQEWKNLPKQKWEEFQVQLPSDVDPLGFDKNNKVTFNPRNKGFETASIPATEKKHYLGQIVGSRSEGSYLGMFDTVYIRADEPIQIGETYAITREPILLKSKKSDRVGYSYPILGKVKILAVRDDLFVGTILSAQDFLARGSSLIAMPPKIKDLTPIPGPTALQGILMVDHYTSSSTTAQFKEVFIDRGSDDNVKPGMVFRVYEHTDPSNKKKITSSDFIIDADIMVTQVCETFSTGVILNSHSVINEEASLVLLTDISDLLKNPGFNERGGHTDELDDLDKLDNQGGLGKAEKKELQQLEQWKGNPDTAPHPGNLGTTPVPPPPPGPSNPLTSSPSMDTPPPPPPPSAGSEMKAMPNSGTNLGPNSGGDTPPPPPPPANGETSMPPPPPTLPTDSTSGGIPPGATPPPISAPVSAPVSAPAPAPATGNLPSNPVTSTPGNPPTSNPVSAPVTSGSSQVHSAEPVPPPPPTGPPPAALPPADIQMSDPSVPPPPPPPE